MNEKKIINDELWIMNEKTAGFSERNINFMLQFFKEYNSDSEIMKQPVSQLDEIKNIALQIPWGHNVILIMIQFYQTYSQNEIVSIASTQLGKNTKKDSIIKVLSKISWSHHIDILSRCKTIEEKILNNKFYLMNMKNFSFFNEKKYYYIKG